MRLVWFGFGVLQRVLVVFEPCVLATLKKCSDIIERATSNKFKTPNTRVAGQGWILPALQQHVAVRAPMLCGVCAGALGQGARSLNTLHAAPVRGCCVHRPSSGPTWCPRRWRRSSATRLI